ncbi:hypothetical protein BDP81DRAFT_397925 [Colletotrichum phormii]|uniref:Non-canonical non-ribosomal peptide synthetase FUB8 n=1 Tax=Colletotrichum phormii TaxID=359342 RepID=A0AAJ0EBJ9_9PEZI|nr:uncharacterized protein BDP81DRAFT_397925 [Colletotrichum phormii]KAK1625155.1 hypothetical protein BDP81DRAFT_397925 [Colletotrichum phormii]
MATQTTTTTVGQLKVSAQDRPFFTLDELIKRRALELGDAPLLGYPNEGLLDFEKHSARAVDRYVDVAVQKLQHLGLSSDSQSDNAPVIGILAHSGLNVVITIMALSRLGYAVFLLSARLQSPGIARLCELADCGAMLTTSSFHPVLAEVQEKRKLDILPLLSHSDYYGKDAPVFSRAYDPERESTKIAAIIHSSGSTGLPKPIYLTHKSCIGAFSVHMNMRAFIKPIYYGNYSLPLTRQSLVQMINCVKPEIFHVVPYVVKLLAETDEGIRAWASVKLVLFGCSSCPDDLGDRLVKNGVYLVGNYGSAGAPAKVLRTGQLVGDSKVGEWNTTEGIPLMIQTAVTLGALPNLDEEMTWLPVDHAATAILELVNAYTTPQPSERDTDPDLVYHILNPTRFHWTRDMLPSLAKAGLQFESLPTAQWMDKLRKSERDPKKNPPIKLLDWFESKYGRTASANKGVLAYMTEKTENDSPTLRGLSDVTDVEFITKLVERLKARWAAEGA